MGRSCQGRAPGEVTFGQRHDEAGQRWQGIEDFSSSKCRWEEKSGAQSCCGGGTQSILVTNPVIVFDTNDAASEIVVAVGTCSFGLQVEKMFCSSFILFCFLLIIR